MKRTSIRKATYRSAGVNIDRADDFLSKAKEPIKKTFTPGVLAGIGHFSAFFQPDLAGYKEPVLLSSTDGVGTKLKVAQMSGVYDTVGQDLVNHCVNDILCGGAKPLFFLDYLAMGKLDPDKALQIINGLCKASQENGMALVGGETAEMPGIYQPGDFDLAGTIVGIAEKSEIINGSKIKAGDALIGIPSTGLHTNGYSLARKICFEIRGFKINDYIEELGCTIGEELLKVHRSYLKVFDALKQNVRIKGLSHITGGGIIGNTKRIIPDGLELDIDWQAWEWLPIFRLLQEWGGIAEEEMRKVFNLGVGLIVIVEKSGLEKSMTIMRNLGEQPVLMGRVI